MTLLFSFLKIKIKKPYKSYWAQLIVIKRGIITLKSFFLITIKKRITHPSGVFFSTFEIAKIKNILRTNL